MPIFSNNFVFPALQLALLALLLWALWRDYASRGGGITVRRGPESMDVLQRATGLVIAAIVTIVNKSVFDDSDTGWRHYSAAINAFDLASIVYLCYVSSWGRNKIIGVRNRSQED